MATEKRCDATHALIVGIDAGEGPMILHSGEYAIRVEVLSFQSDKRHPNLRWEAVRRMIEAHTDDPVLEGQEEADVIALRRDA